MSTTEPATVREFTDRPACGLSAAWDADETSPVKLVGVQAKIGGYNVWWGDEDGIHHSVHYEPAPDQIGMQLFADLLLALADMPAHAVDRDSIRLQYLPAGWTRIHATYVRP